METRKTSENFRKKKKRKTNRLPAVTQAVIVIERRYRVVEMKRDGWTNQAIAQSLGISPAMVAEDISFVLTQAAEESKLSIEQERQLQIEKLDQLIKTFTPYATQAHERVVIDRVTKQERTIMIPPDPEYARLILTIEERRAKLLGLDRKSDALGELASAVREYRGVRMEDV